ncbi:taste receptor, type 2, member 202 [Chanos chanos]|uniref:Vomeronasal type-1 receptor n=1 Tax=Chanos chanos TaxID=29144 RepID=A0A6J2ULD5_CHACN|nr:uncharacterized protein LOC115804740 [Chanos chanos]
MLPAEDKTGIWLLTGLLAVNTIFFYVFILLVNIKKYNKDNHLNPGDTIITAISLTSCGHQILAYFWMTMDEVDRECLYNLLESVLLTLVFGVRFSIMWTTSFLTFYYGTKLVIEPICCYTKIQEAILKHVLTIIVFIILAGFATCLPLLTFMSHQNATKDESDCGAIMPAGIPGKLYMSFYVFISDIVPGVLMIKSSISISVHLAIHLRNMKASTNSSHAPKLGSQMRVIKMTLTLVVVFLCFLAVDLYVHVTVVFQHENTITMTILFATIYTMVSAFVLVYGRKSCWTELLRWYNLFLDEFPCLRCLKVPENKSNSKNVSNATKSKVKSSHM